MVRVSELMNRHIVGIAKTAKLDAVLKLMRTSKVSILPVIENKLLVGIVTRKVVEDDNGAHSSVGEIMKKPVFVEQRDDMQRAIKEMLDYGISRVPVVNNKKEMHCVGVVTSTEVVMKLKN